MKRFDFPPAKFPIVIEALHHQTRAVVWSRTITEPDDAALVHIPPLARQLGHPVLIRVKFGDGTVDEQEPEAAG